MPYQGVLGLIVFLGLCWIFSEKRLSVNLKHALIGLLVQFVLAYVMLQSSVAQDMLKGASHVVEALKSATQEGTSFVFGYLGSSIVPFDLKDEASSSFIFAFQALPMVMVISALSMLLFHWGILPFIVKVCSKIFQKTLNIGGALSVAAAAKVFLGNIDSPILIRPYLSHLTRSELFTLMTCGMATTSATVMTLYSTILEKSISHPIAHILTSSLISIPAAVVLSRVLIPQTTPPTSGELSNPYSFRSSMDAVSKGTADGLSIFLNIMAMLIVVITLVALLNKALGLIVINEPLSLQLILGYLAAPIAWLMGIPFQDVQAAGQLLGTKVALNEVIAFIKLSQISDMGLTPFSKTVMVYAICGFANFSVVGIIVGGLGSMVPERRSEIVELSVKSMLVGALSSCQSGAMVGLILSFGN